VGYFLRTESVGGHICPPSVFSEFFSEHPLNSKILLFFYWLNGILGHI
jgi:hypothetical protein